MKGKGLACVLVALLWGCSGSSESGEGVTDKGATDIDATEADSAPTADGSGDQDSTVAPDGPGTDPREVPVPDSVLDQPPDVQGPDPQEVPSPDSVPEQVSDAPAEADECVEACIADDGIVPDSEETCDGCAPGACDGLTWTPPTKCEAGKCVSGGEPQACDDGEACTEDTCDAESGCKHQAVNEGLECLPGMCSGLVWIQPRTCKAGKCSGGQFVDCDDTFPCTVGACDAAAGCSTSLQAGACFVDGKCRADGEKSAADPCLGCVPAASQVAWMPVTGGPCDDGDAATVNDTCTETGCHGCKQECTGKVCGDDGCGGSCGQCALGQKCEASGTCSPDPCGGVTEVGQCMGNTLQFCSDGKLQTYDCTKYGKVCGFDETNQWYDCVDAGCQPACAGKQCGGDGCGGSCGTCPAGKKCSSDGSCSVTDCGSIDEKGCCSGQVLKYCSNGLKVFDCKEYGKDCAYDPGAGWADCMTPGTGQPAAVCP